MVHKSISDKVIFTPNPSSLPENAPLLRFWCLQTFWNHGHHWSLRLHLKIINHQEPKVAGLISCDEKNATTVFIHKLITVKLCKLVTSLQSFVSLFSYPVIQYLFIWEECYLFYLTRLNFFLFWKVKSTKRSNTFAVLNTTFLQSGRILTDQAGRSYCLLRKVTTLSLAESMFARNATQPPDWSL